MVNEEDLIIDDETTPEEKELKVSNDVNEAYDYLGLDKEEVDANSIIGFSKEDNEILKVQNIAKEYKATLEGKKKDDLNNKYIQTNKAIASQRFIDLTYSMLNSFAEQSNIVSGKDIDNFFIQYRDAFNKMQNALLRDRGIEDKSQSLIVKLFKDKLLNIGEIITNNKGNMEAIVGRYHNKEDEDGFKINQ